MRLQPLTVPWTQEMYCILPGMMQTGKWKSVCFFRVFLGLLVWVGFFYLFWFAFVFVSFLFTVWLLCTARAKMDQKLPQLKHLYLNTQFTPTDPSYQASKASMVSSRLASHCRHTNCQYYNFSPPKFCFGHP